MGQKFMRGDRVHIAENLGSYMRHFPSGKDAVVVGSYRDTYPRSCGPEPDGCNTYTLRVLPEGDVSWYYEHQLTLIESAKRCPTCGQVWEEL